jgi:hypothetical protein
MSESQDSKHGSLGESITFFQLRKTEEDCWKSTEHKVTKNYDVSWVERKKPYFVMIDASMA